MNRLNIFLIAALIVISDQLSKFFISRNLILGERLNIIENVISFTKTYNTGAAFSILEGRTSVLLLFSILVTVAISVYLIRKTRLLPLLLIIAWGLILGGTVGNMIDRLVLGHVTDFIKLDFIDFPIFNLADLSINIGAILILIYTVKNYIGSKKLGDIHHLT